jgi:hypothetical protein
MVRPARRAELVTIAAAGGKSIDLEAVHDADPEAVVDPGHPVETLVELSHEADLLIVGSRGLHGPRALGSVSERVAHRAALLGPRRSGSTRDMTATPRRLAPGAGSGLAAQQSDTALEGGQLPGRGFQS